MEMEKFCEKSTFKTEFCEVSCKMKSFVKYFLKDPISTETDLWKSWNWPVVHGTFNFSKIKKWNNWQPCSSSICCFIKFIHNLFMIKFTWKQLKVVQLSFYDILLLISRCMKLGKNCLYISLKMKFLMLSKITAQLLLEVLLVVVKQLRWVFNFKNYYF